MKILIMAILAAVSNLAFAELPACNGDLLQGTIVQAPYFAKGSNLSGVELSHTHIRVSRANANANAGEIYDVAIDNVFASDYDQSRGTSIPLSYSNALQVGQSIQLCGKDYTSGSPGIHWVHTNCGNPSSGPDGYTISNGQNLTSNQEYCYLWSH